MASPVAVPRETQGPSGESTVESILQGFEANITPIRTTATYRLGILAVSVVMVLLPLIYIALIALVGFLVYWHTVHNVQMLEYGRGRGKVMVLLMYVTPMIVGSIMTFFMMKPLFARASQQARRRSLSRDEEPVLFAFVDRICQAVRAPKPKRIDVDCQINASAGFRRGFWSMLLGNDLVLTIGMPLVMGFSLRQFAGVLAHEFGHFSQGAGMRLTFVIRSISMWFTRVVYERDAWDEWLDNAARELDLRISWVLHLARFFVWLSRRILWVLMVIGHAVAGYMLRQMEFDADRHECRLAGSDVFASTVRRLIELNIANAGAQQDLQQFYHDGRLGDDLPRLIQVHVQQSPQEYQAKITELIEQSKTGRFDTHPCDKDRIANAQRENAPGVFRVEGPASILFRDVAACSRRVTIDFYKEIFGEGFRPEAVHPLDDLLARQNLEIESMKALARYFQGAVSLLRPLPIPSRPVTAPSQPKATADQLQANRRAMVAATPAYQSAFQQFDAADTQLLQVHCANSIFCAHEKPRPGEFTFSVDNLAAMQVASQSATSRAQAAESELSRFEIPAKGRFTSALELLFDPVVAQKLTSGTEQQGECHQLLPLLQELNSLLPQFMAIRNTRSALAVLFSYVKQGNNSNSLVVQIHRETHTLHEQLVELKRRLQPFDYPFDHAQGPLSAGDFVLKMIPPEEAYGPLFDSAADALEKAGSLVNRSLGRLAQFAENVESALGLPPLPIPGEKSVPMWADVSE